MVELTKCDKCGVVESKKTAAKVKEPTIRRYIFGRQTFSIENPMVHPEDHSSYDLCKACYDSLQTTIQSWFDTGKAPAKLQTTEEVFRGTPP